MPTKSNNMSPMPMQSKIGEASLKFGPDWLRALSSSETTGPNTGGPSPSGDGPPGGLGGPPRGFGFSGWGTGSEGRSGFHSNNKEHHHNYSAAATAFSSPPSSFHQHSLHHHGSPREFKGTSPSSSSSANPARLFKQSEVRYSREEMLALYDKNLDSPSFLMSFGTLYIEKMQPPLAFSQPAEEEIRIWHIPQPESSRQGPGGTAPVGRGYATRGRGGGIDRGGRGRGRGSYSTYGTRGPHEEEDRGSFSRPRNFERSQSNHERTAWGERNGVGGGGPIGIVGSGGGGPGSGVGSGGGPIGPDEGNRGSGSWRSRESFGGRREENEDGWRKPRWRRGDEAEEQEYRSGGGTNSRRLHRSWSEEENHDNIPEWARDNPSEESGTFDATGAFHGDDRSSKSRETTDRKADSVGDSSSSSMKSRVESEHSGSHSDRVQKRVQDRTEPSVKPVIPASVKEEAENPGGDESEVFSSRNRGGDRSGDHFPISNSTQYHHHASSTNNSITNIQKQLLESESHHDGGDRRLPVDSRSQQNQQHIGGGVVSTESLSLQKQRVQTVQHQMTSTMHAQSLSERINVSSTASVLQQGQHGHVELRASSNTHESKMSSGHGGGHNNEEDHYRSMTEEAMNLVSKLIEEDGTGSRRLGGIRGQVGSMTAQQQALLASMVTTSDKTPLNVNDLSRTGGGVSTNTGVSPHASQNIPPNTAPTVHPHPSAPSPSLSSSMEVWFYRDPQGSVQGPFSTHEMGLWCSQGYFSGSLQLRRECDKIFITLLEMGKVYGRNPFAESDSSPPPPIQDPNANSALDFPRGGSSQLQAQLQHQQRQHAMLQQQNLMREQQQYMMNLGHGAAIRKETDPSSWQQSQSIPPVVPQQTRSVPNNSSLTSEQIQAQLLMSMAKSQGLDRDPNAMDQLHALFQRQLKNASNEALQSQNNMMGNSQSTSAIVQMDVPNKSSPAVTVKDPIQSLVQQLTSMANTQHKISSGNGGSKQPDVISPWGQTGPSNSVQVPPSQPNQWGSAHPTQAPWEYREQMAKLQEEEHRRRKEEEELERKRLVDEEEQRKRLEDQQRIEHERKRLEEQQRIEEEKQRKMREEQYLIQKLQQEMVRKQQEEAEIQRQKELQRQQLEQQRQLRDEQTRLAEEQQKLEEQRLEKERKEQVAAERELKLRSDRDRERQDQIKLQQQHQFSWNSASPQGIPPPIAGGGSNVSKSLIEIQQEESINMEKEASQKKKAAQEQLRIQAQVQAAQAQQQKAINLKWAQGPAAPMKAPPIKSLTEIQAEEQAKLQKQQEQEREKRAIINHHQQQQAAWSAQLTWADRAAALAAQSGGSGSGSKKTNGGAWEDNSMASKLKQGVSNNPLPSASVPSSNNRPGKKTKEMSEDSFMKLFSLQQENSDGGAPINLKHGTRPKISQGSQDDFTRWCSDRIQAIASGSVDIPTFVSFLKEVESPYEVGDYVRSYLGDGKEAKEFSREFLERRSRWKNARKEGTSGSFEDNLCRPASAVNPNSNDFQEVKAKGKKTKKGKMQKVDSRILGFSTSAAADRLNRDYGDSTD